MTPAQASQVIGCTPQQVRYLIRRGKLRATRRAMPGGFYYHLSDRDVFRYANIPQAMGFPRGQSRPKRQGTNR